MSSRDLGSLFDDDADERTVIDVDLDGPVIPNYPALAVYGPFEILGRIARGGMAEVYLAREPSADGKPRHVVLKRILPEREDDADFIRMFREEANLARRLYHPNVCHVYEAGELDGRTFMTLEWVYGVSLRDVLRRASRRGKAIPVRLACHIAARVAAALDYVHRATGVDGKTLEIVHRDVSPHNVMIGWDGKVKLLDFGIAKTSAQEESDGGVLKGKHAYLSPEQARGHAVDPRTDIFALGIVTHELLTGRPLYHREGVLPTLDAIVNEPPPSPRGARADIPPKVDALVLRALQKAPVQRFPTAGHFRQGLEQALDELGGMVLPGELAKFLDELFGPEDRAPLPEQAAKLTGSFAALTDSYSASYGPFSDQPRRSPPTVPPPALGPPPIPQATDHKRVGTIVAVALAGLALFALAFAVAFLLAS